MGSQGGEWVLYRNGPGVEERDEWEVMTEESEGGWL